jgi:hypothetical protein
MGQTGLIATKATCSQAGADVRFIDLVIQDLLGLKLMPEDREEFNNLNIATVYTLGHYEFCVRMVNKYGLRVPQIIEAAQINLLPAQLNLKPEYRQL